MSTNPATTHPTDLPPTPPRAPGGLALPLPTAPCNRCGTRGGLTLLPSGRAVRKRGLCVACYAHEQRAGRLGDWSRVLHVNRGTACLSCGDAHPVGRGLCQTCFSRAWRHGIARQYPACGAVPVPNDGSGNERFEGFPEGHIHTPTGWPLVPALVAPLHPPLPAPTRWGAVIWYCRPQHDPVGQALFDAETRADVAEAA